jgi:hypothetical protein
MKTAQLLLNKDSYQPKEPSATLLKGHQQHSSRSAGN